MAQTVPGTRLGKVHKPGARAQHVLEDAIKPGAHLRSLLDEPVRFVGSSRDELKASLSLAVSYTHLTLPTSDLV